MKSERPQIHESNLLADKVESFLVKVRDKLPLIGLAVAAFIVGLIGWGVYKSSINSQSAVAWSALYFSDTNTDDLNAISQDFSKLNAGRWALQAEGDSHLAKGAESVFVNRDIADQHYQKAVEAYEAILGKDRGRAEDSFVTSRAYYGLAQAYEGLGKREEAIKAYRKIAEQREQSAGFLNIANQRADWLESKSGEEFFAWYSSNRQSAPTIAPSGTLPELPSQPTINFSDAQPPAQTSTEEESADSSEATDVIEDNGGSETTLEVNAAAENAIPESETESVVPESQKNAQ